MKKIISGIIEKAIAGIISGLVVAGIIFVGTKIYFPEEIKNIQESINNPLIEYSLNGRILDNYERPVSNVIIGLIGRDESTRSDSLGYYNLRAYFKKIENNFKLSFHHSKFIPLTKEILLTEHDKKNKTIQIANEQLKSINDDNEKIK